VVLLIALPVLGLRLGTSDSGTDPASWTTHQAYAALAAGFGPGFNGPLQLVGRVSSPAGNAAFDHLLAVTAHTPGVASVTKPIISPNGFGLAFSVLVDAVVIRSLLLPVVMHLIGPANWALPNWLGRVLPHLGIEQSHQDPGPRVEGIGAIGTS
jgi:uncharacterized membrane protein YdfJ with MMPL/SSD domain